MKAVHFGAGNIGRGFIGLLLHEAGYEVVFADVNADLIDAIQSADSYDVHEVGEGGRTKTVTGFRAINSAVDEEALVSDIATADIVTTAVGPNVLRFVAPVIARGLLARSAGCAPLAVMACENAISATDTLAAEIRSAAGERATEVENGAVFANTAVDRIVPGQDPAAGIDVTVETFCEWVIEAEPFAGAAPVIPGATFVDALGPYIERKLFTVNTGHATAAYAGFAAGHTRIAEAFADPAVRDLVERVLRQTSALLVAKHELDPTKQDAYREKILVRFANDALPDTVVRVGRQPLRKLSRDERFIGPAAQLAERGMLTDDLVEAVGVAIGFDVPEDPESVEMQQLLRDLTPEEFVERVTGLSADHPLSPALVEIVSTR
ncbi:D-mannitol 1-phosphate 5-dehydrogenase [Labedella gwakjiensis]|uniref:Mannitol-1-phosphate 5-dehydrogenase n=1 Tax=Labedella gwakjiensis TaxID=390269 RepID=A0A2P8GRX3_9MICO|nr:mannitol-1-phosphate 5-dehydrogenase [Labedella gwakjiensis]PSL36723.1 D-mannitol 1-phosphate 5-dehydrogenase [Labedella gwakjiensis]RUQ84238.1 mannitol-1-phosphate 5-dehydrogenase [Labedella gwakjiensis]